MTDSIALERLDQSDLTLAEGEQDLRYRTVVDASGEEIGRVDALYVDPEERRVRFLDIRGGGVLGVGESEYLVPVEAIDSVDEDQVRIGHARERMDRAPRYDPDLIDDSSYWSDVYGWYGYPPYWAGWDLRVAPRRH